MNNLNMVGVYFAVGTAYLKVIRVYLIFVFEILSIC